MAGYYSVKVPHSNHRIIILNSVLFSPYLNGLGMEKDAQQELAWLDDQLVAAEKNQEQVLLALHVPPGIDVYLTLHHLLKLTQLFWNEPYTEKFIKILGDHRSVITGIIGGHIHKDAFQILTLKDGKEIPVTFVPSISPVYRNNPGIKVYELDDNAFNFKNFNTYFLSLSPEGHWTKEYNFNEKYQTNCTTCNLLQGFKKLMASTDLSTFLEKYYMVNVTLEIPPADFSYYHCGDHEFTQFEYHRCLAQDYLPFLNNS